MIPFNEPLVSGNEIKSIKQVLKTKKLSGDGEFTKKCQVWLEKQLHCAKALLTTSGTAALEMAAVLADIQPGDEVIMPSYTFTSTANAFVLRGAKIVFVDIRPDTMNLNEKLIESAITKKTKAIVPVHYAGISCEMQTIMKIARKHHLLVIEDAAQGILAQYQKKYLGTIGDIGCLSFHETKNITCGEGGAIILNNKKLIERAEIIREKGTNRSKFLRGEVDKYTWVDIGSSYLPSELNAAFLYPQLKRAKNIIHIRLKHWWQYYLGLQSLVKQKVIELPGVPPECQPNGHMFYLKTKNLKERFQLIDYLKKNQIKAVFHYSPLHSSPAGRKYGRFSGRDVFTTRESERLLRLPMYAKLSLSDINQVIQTIRNFYEK